MSDRLTDSQITEGLRLAGEGKTNPSARWAFVVSANLHYAAVLAEVQALRKVLCEQAGNEAAGAAAQSQRLCDHERQMSEWEGER